MQTIMGNTKGEARWTMIIPFISFNENINSFFFQ